MTIKRAQDLVGTEEKKRARANVGRLRIEEPEVLRIIGEESKRKKTNLLSSKQIQRIIREARTYSRSFELG